MAQEIPVGRSDYKPGMALDDEPTPVTDPQLFSSEDLIAEVKHLIAVAGLHKLEYEELLRIVMGRGDMPRLISEIRSWQ